jgi:hypothetical protein
MKIAFKCVRGSLGCRNVHQNLTVSLLRSGKRRCLCDGTTWLKCDLRDCFRGRVTCTSVNSLRYGEYKLVRQLPALAACQNIASQSSLVLQAKTLVTGASYFEILQDCTFFRFVTVCTNHVNSGNYRIKQVPDVFFPNATTCPLWTSWSPLPVVAEV